MIFIYVMSSQTGSASGETSGRVVQLIGLLGVDVNSPFGQTLHFIIRKGAHFFEYFILSLLLYNYFRGFMGGKKLFIFPVLISFLYACSDEFHQTFVPGRAGMIMDVLIDTTGAIVAILLVSIYRMTIKKWWKCEDAVE